MQVRRADGGPCNASAKSHAGNPRRGCRLRRFRLRPYSPAQGADSRPGAI